MDIPLITLFSDADAFVALFLMQIACAGIRCRLRRI